MSARKQGPEVSRTLAEQVETARSLVRIARELHAKADHDLAIADTGLAEVAAQLAAKAGGAS